MEGKSTRTDVECSNIFSTYKQYEDNVTDYFDLLEEL